MLNGNGSVDTSTHRLVASDGGEPPIGRFNPRLVAVIEHRPRASRVTAGPRPDEEGVYRRVQVVRRD